MAVASVAMIPPGAVDSPYYAAQMIYDTEAKTKRWPPRLKLTGPGSAGSSGRGGNDRSPDSSAYLYGTVSSPGGSALSKSMKYAETWLYGTVRTHPTQHRPSLFTAYPEVSGPVLISTPQKSPANYAVILCSCPDYLNGTKKSSSTKVSICKKCKGSRLPLTVPDRPRLLLGGTVRGPQIARDAGVLRAGTVKVHNSKHRPSILKSQNGDSLDPYDFMRRSRLAPPHEARIGSQFSTARSRAKSISPSRRSEKSSPSSDRSRRNRSKSVSRVNELWVEDNTDYLVDSKRSILTCDVNAYELMNTRASSRSKVEIEFDDDLNAFSDSYGDNLKISQQPSRSNYKAISGQRVRVVNETKTCTVEEVSVYDPVNIKDNLNQYDLKTHELSASVSLPSTQNDKSKKKTFSYYNNTKKPYATSTPISRVKTKTNSPKRPPRKIRTNRTEEDSESDNQRDTRKIIEKRTPTNTKLVKTNHQPNDTIKSILKKPRISINETCPPLGEENNSAKRNKNLIDAQFYIPTSKENKKNYSNHNTITSRKRVQFLVEREDTKIIYTAEFNFTEDQISNTRLNNESENRGVLVTEIANNTESCKKSSNESTPKSAQVLDESNLYEDVIVKNIGQESNNNQVTLESGIETSCIKTESNDPPKVIILRRSESERLQSNVAIVPKFLDSMALRAKTSKPHTSQVFLGSTTTLIEDKKSSTTQGINISPNDRHVEGPLLNTSSPIESTIGSYKSIDWNMDTGNISDNSDFTEEILRSLRKSISMSPEPPPRYKIKDHKENKNRKNNYVKTRFVRTNSTSSTSDEYSDNNDFERKTVLRVKQSDFENVSKNNCKFDESYEDCNSEPRRTSIQINGDDCYSTMNVSNNAPIYLSSVVVNDDYSTTSFQTGATVTISINSSENKIERSNSQVYIGTELSNMQSNMSDFNSGENCTINNLENSSESTSYKKAQPNKENEILNNSDKSLKQNGVTHVCGKHAESSEEDISKELAVRLLENDCENKDSVKFGFVAKLLDDPLLGHLAEGLDSALVTKLIESSLLRLQESKANSNENDKQISKDSVNNFVESSLRTIQLDESQSKVAKTTSEDKKHDKLPNGNIGVISAETEENGCSAPYESMEYESGILGISSDHEPLSDCYNASASELSTEDDGTCRSKFYQMLVDATLCEIETSNSPEDDHLYESIRLNADPIYEEISDIPPPLPINPPPSSLLSLDDDKKTGSRSIFEGASKYDILSYLVDAKERGIDSEETYITNYGTELDANHHVERPKDKKDTHDRSSSDICSNVSQLSNSSDSSEDNSLVIGPEIVEKSIVCKKTSAEIERNDSGVGSETSKCSRSRWQGRCSPSNSLLDKESPIHLCEDCDTAVETQITESGAMYAPLVCRKCAKKRAERKEIIMEIVETEEKYGRDLQIILEEFYKPMLVAGLLTQEQLSAIFLNVEELIENNQLLSEKMRDALEIAIEQGDEDLLTVNIGKLMVECSPMLAAFQAYCVRQAGAALLLAGLEKEKELLRIFLRVSQMENAVLRRMNLNSFLMVPVQRVTKYPLLLSRLHRATASCAPDREDARLAQRSVEERLGEMNAAAAAAAAAARDVPLWRRLAAARRTARDLHVADIRLRKMAVDVLEWNHDEARFAMEGKLLFTQPNDNNWRKARTIKLTPINALLVTNGKPTESCKPSDTLFPRASGVREAALLLVREKAGRYTLHREPLYLDRCVVAADAEPDHFFEVHEITTKDSFIFKADESTRTRAWYRQLQFHAQGVGAWRKRRNALANIMINPMLTRN